MILQALCDYYQRKSQDSESGLPAKGFELKLIPFVIVIDDQGQFIQLKDTRESKGKKLVAHAYIIPQAKKRTGAKSYEVANLLWDHVGYLLAQPKLEKPDQPVSDKAQILAENQFASFVSQTDALAEALPHCDDIVAVKTFLRRPEQRQRVLDDPLFAECLKIPGCNMAFQRIGLSHLCCQSDAIQQWVATGTSDGEAGVCLVSGEHQPIARLHDGIGQIVGKPAPLASINAPAFESYGKKQGANFPVGEQSVFEYATALNHLLRPDSPQKLYLAGTTLVCWSEARAHPLECDLTALLASHSDNPDRDTDKVIEHYRSLANGASQTPDDNLRFYVLGLAPNAPARIVVRFWLSDTVATIGARIGQWFDDLEMVGREQFGYPSLYRLMTSTALLHKADNLPPNLMAEFYLAVLQGQALPATLYQGVIRRIKAERGQVDYTRACLIKACLNRSSRQRAASSLSQGEFAMSLNIEERRIGYCLGRLFAVLEKLQGEAQGDTNSGIRDRYYSSASCTPSAVFATLIRLSTHHLKKLNPGRRVNLEKLIGEITGYIADFPTHLNLEQQGQFALGYYHQRQALFTKGDAQPNTTEHQKD
ncbi:type I-C CRISPR-associated protein Cas8c/Csd1 [Ferrimonas kyonanensis]|uniref:type I-C CRISPR-associated protein Cas8c/Csd1 n=1 Tax=Ferrimonas kyonanensis TaxID=364763 RepID=UPI000408681E|nr:type I-C CRISPR-associated protein Cas8c/Csd1 [Ferrimonas kyonanensis]